MLRFTKAISKRYFTASENENLLEKIFEILKKFDTCDSSRLNKNATFDDIGLDSFESIVAVFRLEASFGVNLSTEDFAEINSIPQAISIFEKYTNKK